MRFNISKPYLGVFIVVVLALIPFIGLAEFYSKGEPREAVVALSMLKYGDWILPINNGGDIPYKPPFMHWCIALVSLLPGYVNEFTSRLPSALSLIAMLMGGYRFFSKRAGVPLAVLTTFFTLTAFEVHRAGMAARVDMMLTAFIVGALFLFYRWWEKGTKGVPFMAIMAMTGGVLTKGPVGMLLPCLVMGTFFLLRKEPLFKTFMRFVCYGLAALVIPALWYVAAFFRGGNEFLALMIEENFGRFMGQMSYESHVHPFTYNFVTLIAGWLPFTLLVFFALFIFPERRHFATAERVIKFVSPKILAERWLKKCAECNALQLFTWLSFGLILLFYCIPSSKRSTYLLPCYPFMAFLLAQFFVWLFHHHKGVIRLYVWVISGICVCLPFIFFVVRVHAVPLFIFKGKHAANNILMLKSLQNNSFNLVEWFLIVLPLAVAVGLFVYRKQIFASSSLKHYALAVFLPIFSLFATLDGVYLPTFLKTQSDKELAQYIVNKFGNKPIYSYLSADMLHYFCTNFYLNDNIKQFEKERPKQGTLMIARYEVPTFFAKHKDYTFKSVSITTRKRTETRTYICFYRFEKKNH